MKYKFLYYNGKRPAKIHNTLKKELIHYLRKEFEKNSFPSRRELEKKFHLKLDTLFKNIKLLYKFAGIEYKLSPSQYSKSEKASLLLNLIIKNLPLFGLKLICYRKVTERGIDIIAMKGNKRVGIEIKAYNKYEPLKKRDILQVKRFIDSESLASAIIVTTTDLQQYDSEKLDNLSIIKYSSLCDILSNDPQKLKILSYIRNHSVNTIDFSKEIKKQRILDYVLLSYQNKGKKPSYQDILKDLNLDIYTYFENIFEIYKILKIPPSLKNMGGKRAKNPDIELIELWKHEFKQYILQEVKKGRFPSGEELGKHFEISNVWNIVNVSNLYLELNLKPYLERKKLH